MTTIVTRSGKGTALTHTEVDANFTNLNTNKAEVSTVLLASEKGAASGVCPLDSTSKVSSTYLPSYVDDVLEYANYAALPATGETGKIYVALDTNKTYRWSGSAYVYITSGAVDSVAGKTGVVTLYKTDVGLSNVSNTAQVTSVTGTSPIISSGGVTPSISISAATTTDAGSMSAADKAKIDAVTGTNTGDETASTIKTKLGITTLSGSNTGDQTIPTTLPASDVYTWAKAATKPTYTATEVGLGNVTNTSDANKPISTATQTALDLKAPLASPTLSNPTYTGTLTGSTGILNIGSGQVYKDASGNVGIGSSSDNPTPAAPLHITAGTAQTAVVTAVTTQLRLARSGTGGVKYSTQADFKLGTYATGINSQTQLDIALGNGATNTPDVTVMTLLGSGNVGIGTSSPTGKFVVESNNNMPAASGTMNTGVIFQSGGASQALNLGSSVTNNVSWINAAYSNNSGVASNLAFMTGATERMRIDSSGNVGIGTSSPANKLSVNGYASFTSNTNGNTPADGDALLITGNYAAGQAETDFFMVNPTYSGNIGGFRFLQKTATAAVSEMMWLKSNYLTFSTVNTERMRIDSAGRVTYSNNPAFITGAVAGGVTYTSGVKVNYSNNVYNRGSCWNSTNNYFVAPVAGYYFFKAQLWTYTANAGAAYFRVNGSWKYGSFGNEATNIGFNGYAMVEMFYLAANDYVDVACRAGVVYTDGSISTFSGYLIG